jgi:ferredoxin like protein
MATTPAAAIEIKQRLGTLRYRTDSAENAHITVKPEICAKCPHSFCTIACPAKCYQRIEGKLVFKYEDCVECGACAIACDQGSVTWNNPRGPFGIRYAFG